MKTTLLPLSIRQQRGREHGNTTSRPARKSKSPQAQHDRHHHGQAPWYDKKGEERAHTRKHKCRHRYVTGHTTKNAQIMAPTWVRRDKRKYVTL